jgi:hypothetical protein
MRAIVPRFALVVAGLLAGCIDGAGNDRAPAPRRGVSRPPAWAVPPGPETRACLADLSREQVRYSLAPDQDFGGGCRIVGAVLLNDIGVPVAGLKALRCGAARAFTGWVRHAVVPAAHQLLGSDVVRVETYGSYACRNVIGNAAASRRLSGHAMANAVDVAAFVLADGRRITVAAHWRSADPRVRAFFRSVYGSACKRFGTVLSPDYNYAHRDHFHLEDDGARFCQ